MPPHNPPSSAAFFLHSNSLFFPYAPILCPRSSRREKKRGEESKALPLTSESVITQPSNNSYCCLRGSLVPPPPPPKLRFTPPPHRIHIVIRLSVLTNELWHRRSCNLFAAGYGTGFPLIFRNKCLFPSYSKR